MEENIKTVNEQEVIDINHSNDMSTSTSPTESSKDKEDSVKFGFHNIIEIVLYIAGFIFIVLCFCKLGQDLETWGGEFRFNEESYVGGDAYNYIISAARSSAVMVKSLIFGVIGYSSIIIGLLIRIANRK